MRKLNSKNYFIFSVVVVFAIFAFGTMLYSGTKLIFSGKQIKIFGGTAPAGCREYRRLDGVCLAKGETEKYPVGLIIDNKFEARPWSGLSFANVVYEAPVEGGITRFLALYSTDKNIEKIGPIRSARAYFIDWDMGYGAIFGHVGGSPEALGIIADNFDVAKLNLDQYYEDSYFWRSADRYAPHNVYISSKKLDAARNQKIGDAQPDFSPWQFKDDAFASERGDAGEIKITFSNYETYNTAWKYDKEKNIYIRRVDGQTVSDADGPLILAKNIAVVETDIVIVDEISRRKITTLGGGNAVIFQDGKKVEGKWEKKDMKSMLRFYDINGEEIKFNRGTTWVEVVEDLAKVEEK